MTEQPAAFICYRIIRAAVPQEADFRSLHEQRRMPTSSSPALPHLWRGVSVFDSIEGARRTARLRPQLGRYIAELQIEPGSGVAWEKSGRLGHHTLWGSARDLLTRVTNVAPVAERPERFDQR